MSGMYNDPSTPVDTRDEADVEAAEERAEALMASARGLVRYWGADEARKVTADDAESVREAFDWLRDTLVSWGEDEEADTAERLLWLRLIAAAVAEDDARIARERAEDEADTWPGYDLDLDFELKERRENAA